MFQILRIWIVTRVCWCSRYYVHVTIYVGIDPLVVEYVINISPLTMQRIRTEFPAFNSSSAFRMQDFRRAFRFPQPLFLF